jgi:hypothetical protein
MPPPADVPSTRRQSTDSHFDRESVFLRNCLGAFLFQDGPVLVSPADLNWTRFHDSVVENKLVGLFYRLGKSRPDLWPAQLVEQLREERYRLMLHGDWCVNQAGIVLAALHEAGIPVLVLKGWALLQILYDGHYDQRPSSDMDLLVKPNDLQHVESILDHMGYRHAGVEPWPGYDRRYKNGRHYLSPPDDAQAGRAFNFDLHWGIPDPPYYNQERTMEPFFERSLPIKIAGIEAGSLALEDHLIYTCCHFAHHRYIVPLLDYYEIAGLLLRAGQAVDWEAVLSKSLTLRAVIPLQRVLSATADLWPGVISPGTLERVLGLKPSRTERWVDKWVAKSKGRDRTFRLLAGFTTPGVFRKIGYLLETAFPSPAYLKKYHGPVPLGLWPLLYPWRGVAILKQRFTRGHEE